VCAENEKRGPIAYSTILLRSLRVGTGLGEKKFVWVFVGRSVTRREFDSLNIELYFLGKMSTPRNVR
jgi:hypothetical protein